MSSKRVSVLATLAVIALLGCKPSPELSHQISANLLLISLDTVRADRLGAYGYELATTPTLDTLAAEGVLFQQTSANTPLTLPSHASLLSGLLPLQHGLRLNGQGRFPPHLETLATHLSAANYQTSAFVGAFVLDRRFGLDRGFDHYDDAIERSPDGQIRLEAERPAEEVIDRALDWLKKRDSKRPFFTWVHLYDAHAPYTPPAPYDQQHSDRPYDGEIAYLDAQLKRLLTALEELDADLMIVVVGDHGEGLGHHGEDSHGLLLYESSLHVPWILKGPQLSAGLRVDAPVSLTDVAPTLAALIGHPFTPSASMDVRGKDLSRALQNREPFPELDVYAESAYPSTFGWSALSSLRQGPFKYISGKYPELYDLVQDPDEERNLAETERRIWRLLDERLKQLESTANTEVAALPIDAETRSRLNALGYASTSTTNNLVRPGQGADPRSKIAAFRMWEGAQRALEANRLQEAAQTLSDLVREDPDNPIFRSSLARTLRLQGDFEKAIELYRQAVKAQSEDPAAWYDLAATLKEAGHRKQAIEAGREALRRDPGRPEGLNLLGISYLEEGDLALAFEHFTLAIQLDPKNAPAYNNLANTHRSAGRLMEAEQAYRRATELLPDYPDPWNGLGTLAVEAGRGSEAIQLFSRALSLSSEFQEALLNRGIAYELEGENEKAIADYRALLSKSDLTPHLHQAASTLLERLQNL